MNAFDLILINLPCLLKVISSKSLVFLALASISLYIINNIVFGIEFMGNGIRRVYGEASFPQVEEIQNNFHDRMLAKGVLEILFIEI